MRMTRYAEFQDQLRAALSRLYDPTFRCPALLRDVLDVSSCRDLDSLRAKIKAAIEQTAPEPEDPQDTRAHRFAEILSLRYLHMFTQERAAERLHITVRHLARQQAQATEALAQLLWEQWEEREPEAEGATADSQVEREVSILTGQAPDRLVDVADALQQAVATIRVLADRSGIEMANAPIESSMLAACHPSVLQQSLVVASSYLLRHMNGGRIDLQARREPGTVRVTLRGAPCAADPPAQDWTAHQLVLAQGGGIEGTREGEALVLHLTLPSAQRITVLVIDDNPDLVQFFHLCTAGTPYDITALGEGASLFERIAEIRPDIIVLDLMLPDIDGWDLLAQLHEHPLSRDIPVVLCSVIQEEELAIALGAHVCITKPVRRLRFLQALDEALNRDRGAE
jgi:CheY-like chemotaxis protein